MNANTESLPVAAIEARAEALGNMRGEDVNDDHAWSQLMADARAEWEDRPLRCAAYPDLCDCNQPEGD